MLYAYVNGVKRRAAKGLVGVCKCCNIEVDPFCGAFKAHHWKHPKFSSCSFAGKGESDWHLNWKDKFPESWQEVIFTDQLTGEKHIADIHTSSGVTIEFQNSPISIDELTQRERFYDKLIWVVNASGFDIAPVSLADKEIRKLYSKKHRVKDEIKASNLREISKLESASRDLNYKLDTKFRELNIRKDNLEILLSRQRKFESDTNLFEMPGILSKLPSLKDIQDMSYSGYSVDGEKKAHAQQELNIKIIQESINISDRIRQIYTEKAVSYFIDSREYIPMMSSDIAFLVDAGYLESLYYMKAAEVGSMFAKLLDVGSVNFLKYLEENSSTYTILLNRTDLITLIDQQQAKRGEELNEAKAKSETIMKSLRERLRERFRDDIIRAEENLKHAQEDYDNTVEGNLYLRQKYDLEIESLKQEIEDVTSSPFLGMEQQKQHIKEVYKDKYKLNWKRRREIWLDAHANVFLDFNDSLYRLEEGDIAKKYSHKQFIEHFSREK